MLRILGSPKKLCGGMTRRELLRVGGLGLAGLALPDLLRAKEMARPTSAAGFGRAKSIILLHLWGSPSQLETWDPKPDAPLQIRGELKSIPSRIPGCRVGELFPRVAGVLDRCTVLRSLTHPWPLHSVYFALTGLPAIVNVGFDPPRSKRLWPFIGSIIDHLDTERRLRETRSAPRPLIPANILLPFPFSSQRVGEQPRVGPYAGFLGSEFHPVCAEFVGKATEGLGVTQEFGGESWNGTDPYMGLTHDSHFVVSGMSHRRPEITLDRLNGRQSLLQQFDQARANLSASEQGRQLDRYRGQAYAFLDSGRLRKALDVRLEPPRLREQYGYTLFGQSCLAARRLIEAGSRIVTVFWDEYGVANTAWDTHFFHYPRLKRVLAPGFDRAWSSLITDLEQRGLLDETLVVCTSEHGRTPRLQNVTGGGRDHWSWVYPSLLAGGGCQRGFVLGASDKDAGRVADRPISPKDLLATLYHLLGIDHHTQIHDAFGRPYALVEGEVIREVLA